MVAQERDLTSNLIGAFVSAAVGTGGEVKRLPGITCVRSPLPAPSFNSAFLRSRAGVNDETLAEVQKFFKRAKAGWCFRAPPRMFDLLASVMKRIRISQCTNESEMVLRSPKATFKRTPRTLEVEVVSNFKELQMWKATAAKGFEANPAFFRPFKEETLEYQGLTYFIGLNQSRPVATAVAYISNGIVGVYGVSTIPKARGRGFGEALTAAAAEYGFARGCSVSSLQASPSGYPLYYRMGYRYLFNYQHWIVKHP